MLLHSLSLLVFSDFFHTFTLPMSAGASSSGLPSDDFNDVEDFNWVNEGEGLSKRDRFPELLDLVKKGNRAFRENRMEEAINCYTKASNIQPNDAVILSNRCAAYIRISDFLKQRTPTDSEYRPLNGLDPTIHAELALKDATRLVDLRSNSVKPYIFKANALILLEKYDLARDAILSGLQVDPLSNALQVSLQKLEKATASLTHRGRGKPERSDDFDCTLCLKLLFEPVTTACGHSFCRSCLFQAMDCSNKCPLCRMVLFINPKTCSISVTLNNIIQRNFPEEYAERKSEHESLTNFGFDLLPLFVMDVVLPCQKVLLNIFEPRYRLMVRRIMEGNHRMGMVIIDSTTGFPAEFGCEVEITECDPLPDGRFYLEIELDGLPATSNWDLGFVEFCILYTIASFLSRSCYKVEGRRRFRTINCWDQDGYRVAAVEWVQDILPPDRTKEQVDLQEMSSNAAKYARLWIKRAKEAAWQDRRRLAELFHAEAMMPTPQDPELFSFWVSMSILFNSYMTFVILYAIPDVYLASACWSIKPEATRKIGSPVYTRHKREDKAWTHLYERCRTGLSSAMREVVSVFRIWLL